MLLGARQFFERRGTPTPPLPYDAEVEYLESTGTQYIDTGLYANLGTVAIARAMPTVFTGWQSLFGARTSYSSNAFLIYNGSDQSYKYTINYDNRNIYNATLVSNIQANTATWYDFRLGTESSIDNWSVDYSGSTSFTTQYTILLFAINMNGTVLSGSYRVSSFSVYQDGVLIQDYIPVRKDGVGYMYDRVSGQLFRNQGTGSFLYGPDKSQEI